MANIFKWATSELSQDAFLCWLIESSTENGALGNFAKYIICDFIGEKLHDINKLAINAKELTRQWNDTDISVSGSYDGRPFVLFVEDKTHSTIHASNVNGETKNQLIKYLDAIEKDKPEQKRKIYGVLYKSDLIWPSEEQEIKTIQKTFESRGASLEYYDIKGIGVLFDSALKEGGSCSNDLLEQYRAMIKEESEAISFNENADVSLWNLNEHSIANLSWEKLFMDVSTELTKIGFKTKASYYRGTYLSLEIRVNDDRQQCPLIEIQPRQSKYNQTGVFEFVAKMQVYDLDSSRITEESVNDLRNKLKKLSRDNVVYECTNCDWAKFKKSTGETRKRNQFAKITTTLKKPVTAAILKKDAIIKMASDLRSILLPKNTYI